MLKAVVPLIIAMVTVMKVMKNLIDIDSIRVRGSQNRVAWPHHDPQEPLKPPVLAETQFVPRRFFCSVQPLLRASRVAAGAMGAVVGARR